MANYIKNFFGPENGNKYTAAAVLVLAAVILMMITIGTRLDTGNLDDISISPRDMVTSPAVLNQKQNQPKNQISDDQAPAKQNRINEQAQNQNAKPEPAKTEIAAKPAATVPSKPSTAPDTERSDMVIIPKIGVSAPIVTPPTGDTAKLKKMLDSGAVIYPSSTGIGADGQTILLGHSAPAGWPEIKHDTIFSRIVDLAAGDKIIAIYNDKTYNYEVLQSQVIPKGGDIPSIANGSSLVLITCWPPGRDLKRLVVEAQLNSVE